MNKYRSIVVLLFFQIVGSVHAESSMPAELVLYMSSLTEKYQLVSVKSLDTYIQKEYKSPTHLVGDFNGDKYSDHALLVKDNTGVFELVVFLKANNGFKHQVLYKIGTINTSARGIGVFIQEEKPGVVNGFPFDNVPEKDLVANLSYPGIHLVFFERSSVLYYWQDGMFKELWTSD